MTMKEFTAQLDALSVPYKEDSFGKVDIHDIDITSETAMLLKCISFNGNTELQFHSEPVHTVFASGLLALAQANNIQMTSWDTEYYFKERPEE